jgi:acetoin utilization protein AcuC
MPESASGFCILNDIAVMIQYILDKRPGSKVMYLDVDCHHGDGVQWIFYDRKDVLKLDFHQDGRTLFPGSGHINEIGKGAGKGYSLNVPLGEDTPDELYLDIFTRLVPQVMDAYQPDFLVMQCGVDTYFQDPLTRFGLSTSGHEQIFKNVLKWVPKYCKNKLIALGGGGYNISVVARSWTMYLAAMLNVELPNQLPEKWIREFKSKFPMDDPGKILRDSNFRIAEILDRNHYYLDELKTEQSIIIDKFEKELIPQIKSK